MGSAKRPAVYREEVKDMREEWKDIIGYEGYYKISNNGKVYSIKSDTIMSHYIPKDGYHRVHLCKGGIRKGFQVHRLVALHFCDGYAEDLVVDHIDGDKDNLWYTNLEWKTQYDNVQNMIERGTHTVDKAHLVAWEKNQKEIYMIFPDGSKRKYTSTKECAMDNNLLVSKITDVLKGRRKHHKGYVFEYATGC